jgi:hypothetical protein
MQLIFTILRQPDHAVQAEHSRLNNLTGTFFLLPTVELAGALGGATVDLAA